MPGRPPGAQWANAIIGHFILFEQDRFLTIPVDLRALGVSAGFAILSGLGFGLLPALVAEPWVCTAIYDRLLHTPKIKHPEL